jgi:hypothetical protein
MRKWTAAGLTTLTLAGASEEITMQTLDGTGRESGMIAADAGLAGGTVVHAQEQGGYVALGPRQRVEPTVRRYLGGSAGDYLG